MHINVYRSFIHNCPKLKAMSFNEWVNKAVVNGILFSDRK